MVRWNTLRSVVRNMAEKQKIDIIQAEKLRLIKNKIANYPDFPKPGIIFRDIFPVFKEIDLLKDLVDILCSHVKNLDQPVHVIAALESRGFLFAVPMCLQLKIPFVPIRKKGKLPGDVERMTFDLEYGKDCLEIQKNALKTGDNVVIVDDLLATGGTMNAACQLIKLSGANVLEGLTVLELEDLKGRDKVKSPVVSMIQF